MVATAPVPVLAYDCDRADIIIALDASDSVDASEVQRSARDVLQAIERVRDKNPHADLSILEAIAFTEVVEHSSRRRGGATPVEQIEHLIDAFPNLTLTFPLKTAFAPMLRYVRTRFQNRSEESRGRFPVLIVITDGRGETYDVQSAKELINNFRFGDGFKVPPPSPMDLKAMEVVETRENEYLKEIRAFYGASMHSIAVSTGGELYPRTLWQLTSDSIERHDGVEKRIEQLILCKV